MIHVCLHIDQSFLSPPITWCHIVLNGESGDVTVAYHSCGAVDRRRQSSQGLTREKAEQCQTSGSIAGDGGGSDAEKSNPLSVHDSVEDS